MRFGTYSFVSDYGCPHPGMPLCHKQSRRSRDAPIWWSWHQHCIGALQRTNSSIPPPSVYRPPPFCCHSPAFGFVLRPFVVIPPPLVSSSALSLSCLRPPPFNCHSERSLVLAFLVVIPSAARNLLLPLTTERSDAAKAHHSPLQRSAKHPSSRPKPKPQLRDPAFSCSRNHSHRASATSTAPSAISPPPASFIGLRCSPSTAHASTITSTTLSLSMGATLEAGPICSARK